MLRVLLANCGLLYIVLHVCPGIVGLPAQLGDPNGDTRGTSHRLGLQWASEQILPEQSSIIS